MSVELPAGWDPSTAVLGSQWTDLDEGVRDAALQLACTELWALSGRQFGTWLVELAPFIAPVRPTYYQDGYYGLPYYQFNAAGGVAVGGYGVAAPNRVFQLPRPVVSVQQVTLNGATLTEGADYTADPDGSLVWLAADGGWPIGQNVYVQAPAWTVSYVRGVAVPAEAQLMAARLALAVAQGMAAQGVDKVNGRARDYSRNNVNVQLAAPEELSNAGLTGVPMVDAWLRTVNPYALDRAAKLWSPELGRHRVLSRAPWPAPVTVP